MLIIKTGQLNTMVVTVSQNAELSNPQWLFSFTHIFSKQQVNFIPQDVSTHKIRYDEFVFVEGDGFDEIRFPYEGLYTYRILEQVAQEPPNTNPALAYNTVEWGEAQVIEMSATTVNSQFVIYESSNEDNSNYIFAPGEITPATTISVYSQVLDFNLHPYNSIIYKCDGTTVQSCYSPGGQTNMTDLVALFNSNYPDPPNPSCPDPTYCYCWTNYGTYYDNGDGRIRCEMTSSVYNSLCSGGTITLDVIYD